MCCNAHSSLPYGLHHHASCGRRDCRLSAAFWARASSWNTSVPAQVKIGDMTEPYTSYFEEDFSIVYNAGAGDTHEFTFVAPTTDPTSGLVIFFGLEDAFIQLDSIFLEHISSPECETGGTGGSGGTGGTGGSGGTGGTGGTGGSGGAGGTGGTGGSGGTGGTGGSPSVTGAVVYVNQVGFVPQAEKVATVKHSSTTALPWELIDNGGQVLANGQTHAIGTDPISGDHVHLADFSDYTTAGTNLRIRVGDATSPAFRIGGDVYGALRRDALRFFYHQRASTAVTQPYAEATQWTRAAGHLDTSVNCRNAACSGKNVSQGWYDAGDYGKYVVNGGIAAWTLMSLYERAQHLGTTVSALGDDTLNIPESGNGWPDVLDEVRWEMEFLLRMQDAATGMVHHKVHGTEWPPIPVLPSNDATGRLISAPSTAATLNLAATAAQCARIFADVDANFANKCRDAAQTVYDAAKANPSEYAISTPGLPDDDGGGAYDDDNVTDEFYWAAAELFITTGEARYRTDFEASPHHTTLNEQGAPFGWQWTAGLGVMSLATVPNDLEAAALNQVRAAVVAAANAYVERATRAYGTSVEEYVWGSNSEVLNAGMVMALAYDLTGEAAYRAGALGALDYVLGRNPLGQSST